MEDKQEIKYAIRGIFVNKLSLDFKDELKKILQETKGEFKNYTFEINCTNMGYVPDNLVNINILVKIFLDTEKKTELGFIQVENLFEIENLKRFHDEKENRLNLPVMFETSLIAISLSHTRVMINTKFAGTFLQNAFLPILNPMTFIKIKEEKEKIQNEIEIKESSKTL